MNFHETIIRIIISILIGATLYLCSPTSSETGQVRGIKPSIPTPTVEPGVEWKTVTIPSSDWHKDPEVSWYGPGFYGKRTACGLEYTKTILGVAHRTLPCGTLVEFRYRGRTATVPVIDRGPYVQGRTWDLSGGLCVALDHCFTGPIEWRYP